MGVTKKQAGENKETILKTAERLFRTKGVDAVGLAELMGEAGFTHGGFYNHFASKDALVDEVVKRAMQDGGEQLNEAIAKSRSLNKDALVRQVEWYLSAAHRNDVVSGCPMAGFAGEVSRLNGETAEKYSEGLEHLFETFTLLLMEGDTSLSRQVARGRAIALFSMMAGGVILSRAVAASDPKLANEILVDTKGKALHQIYRHGGGRELKRSPKHVVRKRV